ncbi:o-acyltransferase [Anaeramoeba flamelloides]|uniref:O-acyltransferase n=1 Tax=Anaeramoeba flamelloides TaxID=1746091 RepID=A0AAV7ZG34_9EUKA|nr:o-acyltransferase [Anaeramoeba flamelloides]
MKTINSFFVFFLILFFFQSTFASEDCLAGIIAVFTNSTDPLDLQLSEATARKLGNYGDYDLCRELQAEKKARYCLLEGDMMYSPQIGICAPYVCNETSLAKAAKKLAPLLHIEVPGKIIADCSEPKKIDGGGIAYACVLCLIALFVVLGTSIQYFFIENRWVLFGEKHDAPQKEKQIQVNDNDEESSSLSGFVTSSSSLSESKPILKNENTKSKFESNPFSIFLLQFSLIKNLRRLNFYNPNSFHILDSIRTISMFWIVLGHQYEFLRFTTKRPEVFNQWVKEFPYQIIGGAEFAVDSFFFMSGFLVTYYIYKELKAKGKMNFLLYLVHRCLRLWPTMIFGILFAWKILYYMGSGPVFTTFQNRMDNTCKKYWWTDVLFINNYYPTDYESQCLGQLWYLANDFQMHFFTPLFVYVFIKSKKYSWILIGALFAGSFAYLISMTIIHNFPADPLTQDLDFHHLIYSKPYARLPAYLVGLCLALLLTYPKFQNLFTFKIKPLFRYAMYCAIFATTFALVFSTYGLMKSDGKSWNQAQNTIYVSFSKFFWAIAVGMIVFLALCNYGGPIKQILTHRVWAPLARLTYGVYVLHPSIIIWWIFNNRSSFFAYKIKMIWLYCAFLVFSYIASLIMNVMIESPFMNLEKLIFKRDKKKTN